jgi:ParB-like chromosome segregation protein Spo0J
MVLLQSIRLDPGQPRRLLPIALAQQVYSGRLTIVQAVQEWAKQANIALVPGEQPEEQVPSNWLAERLQRVQELAASIIQLGLIHPINVIPQADGTYLLETGERRALAMAWLVACGMSEYERVPVLFVSQSANHRSRQVTENINREDLSAVEKAKGLWNIRYEMSGIPGPEWDKLAGETGLSEALEKPDLVPWTEVQRQLSIGKRYRIWLTQTMELCPRAIGIIEQHGLAERATRPLVQFLRDDPDGQVTVLQSVVADCTGDEGVSTRVSAEYVESVVKQYLSSRGKALEKGRSAKDALTDSERPVYESKLLLATKRAMRSVQRVMGTKPLSKKAILDITKNTAADDEMAKLARQIKPLVDALATLSPRSIPDIKEQKRSTSVPVTKSGRKRK